MCNYECETCGDESSDEPVVSIVFTKRVLEEYPTKEYPAFFHGWANKPPEMSDDEWGKRYAQERIEYFREKNEILSNHTHHFCSNKCAIAYLEDKAAWGG